MLKVKFYLSLILYDISIASSFKSNSINIELGKKVSQPWSSIFFLLIDLHATCDATIIIMDYNYFSKRKRRRKAEIWSMDDLFTSKGVVGDSVFISANGRKTNLFLFLK